MMSSKWESIEVALNLCCSFVEKLKLGCQSEQNGIVDNVSGDMIGQISLKPISASVHFKSSVKRVSLSKSVLNTKKAKPTSVTPVPGNKASNDFLVSRGVIDSGPSKIDVTSMMKVVQDMHSGEKTFKCSFCQMETKVVHSMKRHIESQHLPSKTVFSCQTCGYTSSQKNNLKRHYMTKHAMHEPAAKAMLVC